MSAVDLARLQFGSTAIYHFLFVPVTIGLAFLTAMLHTWWYRSERPELLHASSHLATAATTRSWSTRPDAATTIDAGP